MSEDDPELWEAMHRLTCIMHELHNEDMLRTDVGFGLGGLKSFVKGAAKVVAKVSDAAHGIRDAPDDFVNKASLKTSKHNSEADLSAAKTKLAQLEREYQSEMNTVKTKHEKIIKDQNSIITRFERELEKTTKAIHDLNVLYTDQEKAKEQADEANRKAEAAKRKADAVAGNT